MINEAKDLTPTEEAPPNLRAPRLVALAEEEDDEERVGRRKRIISRSRRVPDD